MRRDSVREPDLHRRCFFVIEDMTCARSVQVIVYDKNKKYFFIFKCIEKYFCLCYSKINLKQSKQDYTGDIIRGKQ